MISKRESKVILIKKGIVLGSNRDYNLLNGERLFRDQIGSKRNHHFNKKQQVFRPRNKFIIKKGIGSWKKIKFFKIKNNKCKAQSPKKYTLCKTNN